MTFPKWSPAQLCEAHKVLQAIPATQWTPKSELNLPFMRFESPTPADYLLGIGEQKKTLKVIEKLATHSDMKVVWARLEKIEKDARGKKIVKRRTFELGGEIVSCGVAVRCAANISSQREHATRASWKGRHSDVRRAAERLSELLRPSESLDRAFHNFWLLFTEKQRSDIAGEVFFHCGPHSYREFDPDDLKDSESPEEKEARQAEWDREEKNFAYWMNSSLERGAIVTTWKLLEQIAEAAKFCEDHLPFFPTDSSGAERVVANIADSLGRYFQMFFGGPLDEQVAIIISVVTGRAVTSDSIKMRRRRYREHYEKMKAR